MSAGGPRPHGEQPAPHGNSPWGAGRSSASHPGTAARRTACPAEQVSHLGHGAAIYDPHVVALVDELTVTAGAPFADRLAAVPSLPRRTGADVVAHPEAGTLRLADETPAMPEADARRLVVHLPADDATAAALDRLSGRRPGALRAVNG
ncbi:MmyB family transcriptional regulator [Streptomyces sp. NPDC001939]|uniref:MmyB family transcriptional regulator n=1 Tax=Streptomyces sp. NPDC056341 TaxID=3345788 RepID=UPI0035D84622